MVGAFGKRKTPPKAKSPRQNQTSKATKPWKNNCGTSRKNKRKKKRSNARNSSKPSRKKNGKCCAGNGTPNASFRKHSEADNVVFNNFYSKIKGNPPGGFGSVRTPPIVSFCQSDFAWRPPVFAKTGEIFLFDFPLSSTSEHFPKRSPNTRKRNAATSRRQQSAQKQIQGRQAAQTVDSHRQKNLVEKVLLGFRSWQRGLCCES